MAEASHRLKSELKRLRAALEHIQGTAESFDEPCAERHRTCVSIANLVMLFSGSSGENPEMPEITPEMIEAGVNELCLFDPTDDLSLIVSSVYRSMLKAALTA